MFLAERYEHDAALKENPRRVLLLAQATFEKGFFYIYFVPTFEAPLSQIMRDPKASHEMHSKLVLVLNSVFDRIGPAKCCVKTCGKKAVRHLVHNLMFPTMQMIHAFSAPVCKNPECEATADKDMKRAEKAQMGAERWKDSHVKKCDSCGKVGEIGGTSLLTCSRCRMKYYCNATCQKKAWPEHKKHCAAPQQTQKKQTQKKK